MQLAGSGTHWSCFGPMKGVWDPWKVLRYTARLLHCYKGPIEGVALHCRATPAFLYWLFTLHPPQDQLKSGALIYPACSLLEYLHLLGLIENKELSIQLCCFDSVVFSCLTQLDGITVWLSAGSALISGRHGSVKPKHNFDDRNFTTSW